MKSFLEILKFVLPYKFILITAVLFSMLFSISNGLTLYSIVPIIDTLSSGDKTFEFSVPDDSLKLLGETNLNIIETAKSTLIIIKQNINFYLKNKTKKEILLLFSITVVPLVIIRGLFEFISKILFSYAGNRAILSIRVRLFSHLIKLPYGYFHRERSGEIISRITIDVIPLSTAVSAEINNFISGVIMLATNIIILSLISWKLMIFIVAVMPFIVLPISYFGNLVKKFTRKIQEGFADASSHLQETFTGIKVIKSFGMEPFEDSRFKTLNNKIFSRDLKRRIYQNLNPSIVEMLGAAAAVLLFIYGGRQIIEGHITSGEFIFFMLIVLNLFDPVKMISNAINGTKAGEAAAVRILKILDSQAEDFQSGIEGTFKNKIQFDNVSFRYNDNYVIKNINIIIPKGKTAALVGVSGSGKSTMLNMISAFYQPAEGAILFDEINQKKLNLNWIRSKISIVTQEIFLFHDTILENITCGKKYDMQKVIEASRIAHAHDFISKLPDGYNSIAGERGFMLSGGERQRISIARAILSDPEIILFDEATSALDYESELIIQDSLRYLFQGRTSVVVSHRLSTIQDADIIYFLKNGVIADSGTHAELMSRSDGYRMLFSV